MSAADPPDSEAGRSPSGRGAASIWDNGGFSGLFGGALIIFSIGMAVFTFLVIAEMTGISPTPDRTRWLLVANACLVAALLVLVLSEGARIWRARRSKRAGSQLHTRVVALISVAAALPALILAGTATVTLDRALAPWFFGPIRSFVEGSGDFARSFVNLQCQSLRRDSQIISSDLSRGLTRILPNRSMFQSFVTSALSVRKSPSSPSLTAMAASSNRRPPMCSPARRVPPRMISASSASRHACPSTPASLCAC